ncbi:Ycf48-like protein precursor [compost metagenome]
MYMHVSIRKIPARRFTLLVLLLGLGVLPITWAQPETVTDAELYKRPALQSELAPRSLMLSVARAGTNLVAVGERGFILRSQDNGQSWKQIPSPVSVTLTQVTFATPTQGWAVGHAGVILHSKDGGLTWVSQLDGTQAAQLALDAASQALTEHTSDDNQQRVDEARRLQEDGPDKPFLAVHFFDEKHGLVVGAYGLAFETLDGGQHWQSISERLDNPSALHLYGILDLQGTLFIAAEQGLLLRSTDRGQHFRSVEIPANGTLFGLLASPRNHLLAFGLRGKIYRSEDQGDSWQTVANNQPVTLTAGLVLRDGSLLLVDETGRVLSSQDDGRTFTVSPQGQTTALTGLAQAGDGRIVVSGARGLSQFFISDSQRSSSREQ